MSQPFTQDAATVRRALAFGLSGCLERDESQAALQLWERNFEHDTSSTSSLRPWCKQVAARFNLRVREAELHFKVFQALQASAAKPHADPQTEERKDAPAAEHNEQGIHPSAVLLMAFFLALEDQVAREAQPEASISKLRQAWIAQAKRLPTTPQRSAVAWWSGGANHLAGDWSTGKSTTQLINLGYVSLADLLGPVAADRCFSDAVRHLEASGNAALRCIRKYL